MKHLQKGFTLIELLVVIAIVGIIASVVGVAMDDRVVEEQQAEEVIIQSEDNLN